MSINQIQKVFNYEGANVRTVIIDGEPWFVAKDVCAVLGLSLKNTTNYVNALPKKMRCLALTKTAFGIKNVNHINESGLYRLVMRSDKPEAQAFQNWIASEVLPSIRKHGMYMTDETARIAIDDVELFLSRALLIAKEKIDAIQNQLDAAKPKVLFANAVSASTTSISVADLAKILKQNGIKTGQNRLFAWLRENGYLMKTGCDRNMPTQKAMEMQLFEIKESTFQDTTAIRISKTTKVTGKGQVYFVNLFKKKSA